MHGQGVNSPNRRADIQGLRALAVLAVIAFHAGLPLPGGFLGVDVFFVISGFVITGMLHREHLSSARVNLSRFYMRRFKRLAPALAVMVTLVVATSAFVLSPLGLAPDAAKTGISSMLGFANLTIDTISGSYFSAAAESNPLLNTWSLSVEEQFYLLFPALLVLAWFLARSFSRFVPHLMVGSLALLSLALSFTPNLSFPGSSFLLGFYSPLTRVWEFALGALLALLIPNLKKIPTHLGSPVGFLALAALALALLTAPAQSSFPSAWAILAVVATLVLILVGSNPSTLPSKLLSLPPFVKVGDWSYSLYLWHWPFVVFAVYIWPYSPLAPLLAALAACVPALLSYYLVESPLRNFSPSSKPRSVALISVVLLPPIMVSALVWFSSVNYWEPRYASGDVPAAFEGSTDFADLRAHFSQNYFPCSNPVLNATAPVLDGVTLCFQSEQGVPASVAVIGDSHSEHLFYGLAEALPGVNFANYWFSGLPPVSTEPAVAQVLREVSSDPAITTVVLSARWDLYDLTYPQLAASLQTLTAAGKQVFVLDDVPAYPLDAEQCKYGKSPFLPLSNCTQPRDDFDNVYDSYLPLLQDSVEAVPNASLLTTTGYFCTDSFCDMTASGELLYRDGDHLNENGASLLAANLLRDYPDLKQALTSTS